jgi:hypothetical protein
MDLRPDVPRGSGKRYRGTDSTARRLLWPESRREIADSQHTGLAHRSALRWLDDDYLTYIFGRGALTPSEPSAKS